VRRRCQEAVAALYSNPFGFDFFAILMLTDLFGKTAQQLSGIFTHNQMPGENRKEIKTEGKKTEEKSRGGG
jgi:hypothetical protein